MFDLGTLVRLNFSLLLERGGSLDVIASAPKVPPPGAPFLITASIAALYELSLLAGGAALAACQPSAPTLAYWTSRKLYAEPVLLLSGGTVALNSA